MRAFRPSRSMTVVDEEDPAVVEGLGVGVAVWVQPVIQSTMRTSPSKDAPHAQ
jgi:hypothetical protein